MKQLIALLLLVFFAAPSNLSGVWTGTFRGGDSEIPQLFTLKQQGTKITGTGGPDSTEQYPVQNGSITGDALKFEVDTGQRHFSYDLKATDKKLQGSLTIKNSNDTTNTTVSLERSH